MVDDRTVFKALLDGPEHLLISQGAGLVATAIEASIHAAIAEHPRMRLAQLPIGEPAQWLEAVNQLIANVPIQRALAGDAAFMRHSTLVSLRVAEPAEIAAVRTLARAVRALPGAGLRLLILIDKPDALEPCAEALGDRARHYDLEFLVTSRSQWEPRPQQAQVETPSDTTGLDREPLPDAAPAPRSEDAQTGHPPATPAPAAARLLRRPSPRVTVIAAAALAIALGLAFYPSDDKPPDPAADRDKPAAAADLPAATKDKPATSEGKPPLPAAAEGVPATSPPSSPPAPIAAPVAPAKPTPPSAAPAAEKPVASAPSPAPSPPLKSPNVSEPSSRPAGTSAPPSAANSAAIAPAPATSPMPAAPAPAPGPVPAGPATRAAGADAATGAAPPSLLAMECSAAPKPPPSVSPPAASKPGDMVYLVSTARQVVCVTDGEGKVSRVVLDPNQGHSVFGPPPWVVQAAAPDAVQIFFQGYRVRVPRWSDGRIGLQPR